MTFLSGNRLRMSDGSIRHFKSARARRNFDRVARAYKHGWRPGHSRAARGSRRRVA